MATVESVLHSSACIATANSADRDRSHEDYLRLISAHKWPIPDNKVNIQLNAKAAQ